MFVCAWLSVTYINDSCMGLGKAEEVNILTVVDTEFLHWLLRFWKLVYGIYGIHKITSNKQFTANHHSSTNRLFVHTN